MKGCIASFTIDGEEEEKLIVVVEVYKLKYSQQELDQIVTAIQ